ncbi:hypothetical protein [Saccharomonospora azurea]|uniref:hypothetical protein n=1 Tax=Saccharomonospora azurea TaxID=40988 RepID=UPI002409684B|nr:hypothetical protein [Saccharomonospora azurea]
MTDVSRGHGGTVGPPWSVDVLADLHAGVLDEQDAAELWPRVNADPDARAIIDALESTTSDLSGFADLDVVPMPADVASRIDAALERERQAQAPGSSTAVTPPTQPTQPPQPPQSPAQGSNVVSLDAARARRNKRLGWGAGFLAAAAAVVAAVLVVVPGTGTDQGGDNLAQPPAPEPSSGAGNAPPVAVDSGNVSAAIGDISGVRDFGPLENEQRLDACLEANGVDPAVQPVGFRPVTVDGEQAVVVLLTTGQRGQLRVLALAPDCGPEDPGTLMDETVGHQG